MVGCNPGCNSCGPCRANKPGSSVLREHYELFKSPIHRGSRLGKYTPMMRKDTFLHRMSYNPRPFIDQTRDHSALLNVLLHRLSITDPHDARYAFYQSQIENVQSQLTDLHAKHAAMMQGRESLISYVTAHAGDLVPADAIAPILTGDYSSFRRPPVIPSPERIPTPPPSLVSSEPTPPPGPIGSLENSPNIPTIPVKPSNIPTPTRSEYATSEPYHSSGESDPRYPPSDSEPYHSSGESDPNLTDVYYGTEPEHSSGNEEQEQKEERRRRGRPRVVIREPTVKELRAKLKDIGVKKEDMKGIHRGKGGITNLKQMLKDRIGLPEYENWKNSRTLPMTELVSADVPYSFNNTDFISDDSFMSAPNSSGASATSGRDASATSGSEATE